MNMKRLNQSKVLKTLKCNFKIQFNYHLQLLIQKLEFIVRFQYSGGIWIHCPSSGTLLVNRNEGGSNVNSDHISPISQK